MVIFWMLFGDCGGLLGISGDLLVFVDFWEIFGDLHPVVLMYRKAGGCAKA